MATSDPAEARPKPAIASFRELRTLIGEDYAANHRRFWEPGFQAAATYRLGVWCRGIRFRLLRVPVRLVCQFLQFFTRNFYGIELYPSTVIGRRLRIAHQNGIVVHAQAVIGDDCVLRQGVSIGSLRSGRNTGVPRLGNRVEIGTGAVLVGPITVGDDVVIGPNAVVMTSVPAGSIVVSPQCRIMTPPPRRAAAAPQPAPETPHQPAPEPAPDVVNLRETGS